MYQLTPPDMILRLSDNSRIPQDPDNRDYAEYLKWLEAGNMPEPAPELPKAHKQFTGKDKFALFTPEERKTITSAAMADVDMKMFYDSFTIADYITYDDPEMQDGLHFLEQRGFITPARHAEIIAKMSE